MIIRSRIVNAPTTTTFRLADICRLHTSQRAMAHTRPSINKLKASIVAHSRNWSHISRGQNESKSGPSHQIRAIRLCCCTPGRRQFTLKCRHEYRSKAPYDGEDGQSMRCKSVAFGPGEPCNQLEHGALGRANGEGVQYRRRVQVLLKSITPVSRHSLSHITALQRSRIP